MAGKRGLKTFPGGIHPEDDGKALSKDKAIEPADLPDRVKLLMSQHIGAPCKPAVEVGDYVKKGQVVGEAQAFVSAHVHASIAGKVASIESTMHPVTGAPVPAVVIEREGEDEWADGLNVEDEAGPPDADEIKNRINAAGIVGLGGATFPTHVKLSPPPDKPINALILNGAECEPYLTCDYRLMLDKPRELVAGLEMVMQVLGCEKAYIGVEANKTDAFDSMHRATMGKDRIKAELLKVKYPQGAEHQLIKAVLDREFRATELPMEVGAVVHNVASIYAIYEAVKFRRPLIERVVTITGNGVENPLNLLVRFGAPVQPLLEKAQIKPEANKIIYGGPMMGLAQHNIAEMCTVKGTNGILVLADAETWQSRACIRCGKCVENCPYGLVPSELSILAEANRFEAALASDILECKECGCCTWGCPAKRPMVHQIKFAKAELAKMRDQKK